jgi:nitroreductase
MPIDNELSSRNEAAEMRLQARYGGDAQAQPELATVWNPVLDTLLSHRSVRRFSDRPLPPGLIEALVAAAQSAPSSSNLQAWSVIAIEDPARKARLAKFAGGQRHVEKAPLLLVFLADVARLRTVSAAHGGEGEGLDYVESFIVAVTDAAFAAQNTLVALESIGLGGCYIGAMRNHPQAVAEELGLPADTFAVFGMTVGYPDPAVETDVKPRLPQSLVLHRERYRQAAPEDFASYDETVQRFRSDQSMSDMAWTKQAAGRIKDAGSLMGRHILREILEARGFALK